MMTAVSRMGVLAHPTRPQSYPLASQIAAGIEARGVAVWQAAHWTDDDVRAQIAGTDMVIAIGGDGAMLRAARVCAPHGVPVLGVNMGYLGFLTEIRNPNAWADDLTMILAGDYWIERRMMLRVEVFRGDAETPTATCDALNEAVISRGMYARVIRFDTYIDGDWTTSYNADGLILATATGSTAYALACGGPILPPELRNILIVPVAPHLSLDRPIVLPEGACVDVIVSPDKDEPTVVAADGVMLGELRSGDRVSVQASPHVSSFVRLRERNYFYRSLLDRLEPRISPPKTSHLNRGES
jgi:NAD+ kinase